MTFGLHGKHWELGIVRGRAATKGQAMKGSSVHLEFCFESIYLIEQFFDFGLIQHSTLIDAI